MAPNKKRNKMSPKHIQKVDTVIKKPEKKKEACLYAVIGIGRFGFAIAESLAEKGKDVIVIDKDRRKIELASAFTPDAFVMDELNSDNLREAGVAEADVVIIGIGGKLDTSVLATMTVLKLGVKRVIAKATSQEHGDILRLLGAEVIYPEHDMAIKLANKLVSPNIVEYISLSDTVDLTEVNLSEKIRGMTVAELNIRKHFRLNIIAIRHEGILSTEITPDTVLCEKDALTVIGKTDDIEKFGDWLE